MLVTRPLPGGRHLAKRLEAVGLQAEILPTIELGPPQDPSALSAAAERCIRGGYDWIVLTSANGVEAFARALSAAGGVSLPHAKPLGGARIAVVGPATAAAVAAQGWPVDLLPGVYTGEGLAQAFRAVSLADACVLLPVAEAARKTLPNALKEQGAEVDVVSAYRSVLPEGTDQERVRAALVEADLVAFTSPSAAEGFLELAGSDGMRIPAAVIGPVTREAAERLGFTVVAEGDPHTVEGLVEAVARWAAGR